MHILIIGAAGMIGRKLARALAAAGRLGDAALEAMTLVDVAEPAPPSFGEFGYAGAIEWRWARGGWLEPGPAVVWTRLLVPIGFTLLFLQGISELIKRIAFLRGHIPNPLERHQAKSAEEELAEEIARQRNLDTGASA